MLLKKTMGQQWKQRINEKTPQTIENENTVLQNLWDVAKTILRRKVIMMKAFLKKQEKFQM